jgi:hypothetical protein
LFLPPSTNRWRTAWRARLLMPRLHNPRTLRVEETHAAGR